MPPTPVPPTPSATYYWEPTPTAVSPALAPAGDGILDGGAGSWTVTNFNFTTSPTDAADTTHNLWSSALQGTGKGTVIFGGATGGTVTTNTFATGGQMAGSTTLALNTLNFNTTGYILSGTQTLRFVNNGTVGSGGTSGTITVAPGVTATINLPIQGTVAGTALTSTTADADGAVDTTIDINGGGTLRLGGGNGSLGWVVAPGTTVEMTGGSFSGFRLNTINGTLRGVANNILQTPSSLNGSGTFDINGTTQTVGSVTGALNVTNSTSLIATTLNLSLVATSGTSTGVLSDGTGKLSLATTGTFVVGTTYNSSIAFVTQTFAGANTYTGSTSLGRGTVGLDFSVATAPATNIFYNGGYGTTPSGDDGVLIFTRPTLTINRSADSAIGSFATLSLTGKASTANSQSFNGTRLNANAAASILITPNATANTVTLDLGNITREVSSAINFSTTNGTTALSASAIVKTPTGTASTILTDSYGTAYATLGARDWAGKNAANDTLVPATYTIAAPATLLAAATLTGNATTVTADAAANDISLSANTTVTSLRFANTARTGIGLGGNTLKTGGILISNVANTPGSYLTNGFLSPVGLDLPIFNYAGNDRWFSVDTVITDGPVGGAGPTIFGTSPVVFSRDNAFSGPLVIQQNQLILTGNNSPSLVNINGSANSAMGTQLPGNNPTGNILQIGNATASGSVIDTAPVNLGPNAIVGFKRTDDITWTNPTRGLGGFTQGWSGTTTLVSDATPKYTNVGDFTVTAGTLKLDYSLSPAQIISDSARLVLGGGTLDFAVDAQTTTESVRETSSISGTTIIKKTGAGTGVLRLNLLNQPENVGAAVILSAPGIADTDTNATNGILGSRARYLVGSAGAYDWAFSALTGAANTPITAFTSYGVLDTTAGTDTLNPLQTLTGTTTFSGSRTTNSLKLANASGSAQIVDLAAGNTLTLTAGGLLVTGADAVSISNGTLKSNTGTNSELIVHQYNAGGLTIGSVIANGVGNSTLTKSGSGTLTLTGSNLYTGDTHIVGGTLSVSANNNLGLSAGGNVNVLSSSTSSPTVTLDSAVLPAGFQIGTNFLGRQVSAISGNTITLNGNATTAITAVTPGTPGTPSAYSIGGSLVINNGTLQAIGTFGTLDSPGSLTRNRNLTLNGIGGTIDVTGANTLTHVGGVSGPGGLTKTGTGTLDLRNLTYTGPTRIAAGTVKFGASANPIYSSVTVETPATLDIFGFNNTLGGLSGSGTVTNSADNGTISVATSSTSSTAVTLTSATLPPSFKIGSSLLGRGVTAISGTAVTLDGNANATIAAATSSAFTNNATLAFGGLNNDSTFSGTFTNAGSSLSLDKFGFGTLTLTTGAHSHTGTTTISGGKLILTGAGALPDVSGLNLSSPLSSADFTAITALSESIGSLAGAVGTTLAMGDRNLVLSGPNSTTFAGVISGTGEVTVERNVAANQTFSGPNTYDGITRINKGVLIAAHNNALGTIVGNTVINSTGSVSVPVPAPGVTTAMGGQLSLLGGITIAENITVQGTGDASNYQRAISSSTGTNAISGVIILTGTTSYRLGANGSSTLNLGLIQRSTAGGGNITFDPSSGGTVNINTALDNNANQVTLHGGGITSFNATGNDMGTLIIQNSSTGRVGATNALNQTANVSMGQNTAVNNLTGVGNDVATLQLAGVSQTIGALVGYPNAGTPVAPAVTNNASPASSRLVTNTVASTTATLTVGNGNGTGSFDGVIQDGAGITAFSKVGSGNQTLTGGIENTYSGATTVSDSGTLFLNSPLSNTASITINNDSKVQLQAANLLRDAANLSLNGGTFLTGGFSESVSVLTLTGSSTASVIDLGAGASALRFADSSAADWGSNTLTIWNWSGLGTDAVSFGSSGSALTSAQIGAISFLNPAGFDAGTYPSQLLGSGELVPIPEPTGLMTAGAALAAALRRRRRAVAVAV